MAWTSADLAALDAAIKQGVRRVIYGEGNSRKEVEYHTLDEMLRLRRTMADEVAAAAGTSRTRVSFAAYGSGS